MDPEGRNPVTVTLGSHAVDVPAGGLYDQYRMNTPLDVVAADQHVPTVEFFRDQHKTEMQSAIGATLSPNFYYAMSSARLTMAAPTSALRGRLPAELSPLEIAPGIGIASIMFFRYTVADIDAYNEAAVGIAVRPARHNRLGALDTLIALANDDLHSYVLSLPVTTTIAQTRGRVGYGFPKWVTDIDVSIDDRQTIGRVHHAGRVDLELRSATPRQRRHASGSKVSSLSSYTRIDGDWHSTFSQTNVLASGSRTSTRGVTLTLGDGPLTDDVRSLKPMRHLRFDAMTSGQLSLHMPAAISLRAHTSRTQEGTR